MSALLRLLDLTAAPRLVWRHRGLFCQLLRRNIAARYRGSVLGIIWCFAHPLLMLAVYSFVFGIIFQSRWGVGTLDDNRAAFPLIMFCGLTMFNIFAESCNTAGNLIVQQANLVKKVIFPLELLPLITVCTSFVFGLAWFLLLSAGALCFLETTSWTMLLLPLTLLPLLLLSAGLACLISALGVYLRDIPQLVAVVVHILFFMTPIFYPLSLVPERLRVLLLCNPLTPIVEESRKLFLYGMQPDYGLCLLLLLLSLLAFQLGFRCFVKMKKGFADVL
ncbi:ABC transporter permease [uncultured Desulfovibrio sp.]|uniref:ABC transporter permease n=1 Tax=uncultured Desulfovibrio sp. TaxID=167968 RepID=UPI00320A1E07